MVVVAGETRLLGLGRRDASAEVDRLYRRHGGEVLRYATLVMRSRPDAEDVVQATWIRAFRALDGGERVQKPRNWLIKIAHNECRRLIAARKRRGAEVELGEIAVEQPETGRAAALRDALSQLAPRQREALVLRELEGRTYGEIAQVLDVTPSAVETLLFRARRAVREQMESSLGCDDALALIGRDEVTDAERRRLRAHLRACAACATAERQARGRKGALRRLASGIGLPWLGKTLAVGLGASAIGVTAVVVARPHATRLPGVMPLQVDKAVPAAVSPVVAKRREPASAGPAAALPTAPARRAPRRRSAPLRRAVVTSRAPERPTRAPAGPASPAPARAAPARDAPTAATAPASSAVPPAPQPRPVPERPARSLPGVSVPAVGVPAVTVPAVSVPAVSVPAVSVPAVTVPDVTAPAVTVPSAGLPPVELPPVASPAVASPPVTSPAVTSPAVTVALPTPTALPTPAAQVPALPRVP